MTTCPCCSDRLLRHIRGNQTFWFCRHCWQEMPDLNSSNTRRCFTLISTSIVPLTGKAVSLTAS